MNNPCFGRISSSGNNWWTTTIPVEITPCVIMWLWTFVFHEIQDWLSLMLFVVKKKLGCHGNNCLRTCLENSWILSASVWSQRIHCQLFLIQKSTFQSNSSYLLFSRKTVAHVNCHCAGYFYINLTRARVIWEERNSTEKMPPIDWPVCKPLVHFLDWRLMWEAQTTAGSAPPRQFVPGVIRKQAE